MLGSQFNDLYRSCCKNIICTYHSLIRQPVDDREKEKEEKGKGKGKAAGKKEKPASAKAGGKGGKGKKGSDAQQFAGSAVKKDTKLKRRGEEDDTDKYIGG